MPDQDRLLERFLRYVAVDTTASPATDVYPSSPGQLELGAMLVAELKQAGIADTVQDQHGIVVATIPGNVADAPVITLNAHLDTSPETTGAGVTPQVVRDYSGGDLPLGNSGLVIKVSENPELETLQGQTIITTDGTTLLGGDDKAGVAVIMECASRLCETPTVPHGDVRVLFTCDEEIGRGVDHVDVERLAATAAYTLDGPGADQIDVETFSADLAEVSVRGVNIHPSIAFGRMVNAVRAASFFVERLPRQALSPETTQDREGFLHPYMVSGGVDEVRLSVLLRDFDTANLERQADELRAAAAKTEEAFPGCRVEINVQPQYRNLADGLKREPRAIGFAEAAHRRLGRQANLSHIRGGTDGSLLTAKGLPTPNLSTGQHNPHSPLEWVCLEEMEAACELLMELVTVWSEKQEA